MPSGPAIEDLLRSLIAARLKVDPKSVPLDVPIIAELGLDSMEVMQFLLSVEERFPAFPLADYSTTEIQTLRQLAVALEQSELGK